MPSPPASTSGKASPPPDRTPSAHDSPTESTSLLNPSRPRTPVGINGHGHGHNRKVSVGQRSIAGSVRGYGATPTSRSPAEQHARVSKIGQRRILTTLPLRLAFFTLVLLTFGSLVLTLILFINTAMDLSVISLPYRGSGFTEFWLSFIGSWTALGGVLFFSHPSSLYFLTTIITTVLQLPILLLTLLNPHLKRAHHPLLLIPFFLTLFILLLTLLSNFLVRRARWKESQRISRMLTEAAARERSGDESGARAAVGLQKSMSRRVGGFIAGVLGFIAGLAALILVICLVIDLSISAYDSSIELPSPSSQLVRVKTAPWSTQIHLACVEPPKSTDANGQPSRRPKKNLPTILYEPSSGVPGSLALLDTPLTPAREGTENPGQWLFDLQRSGDVGRVCVWDRPGYGFSEVLAGADLGLVANALYDTLSAAGEIDRAKKDGFLLVGEGYGGLVTRVFASRHGHLVRSLLHLDAQTAQTYFSEHPRGLSTPSLFIHRITTRLFPSLLSPLSLTRLPSVILRRSSSLSRILAHSSPKPSTVSLNENMRKARLQETFGSHSHTSSSFRALLESGRKFPDRTPAIVISSQSRMDKDEDWAEGQRGLAEEVTAEEGLVRWDKVDSVGHDVCAGKGRQVCEEAVRTLLAK